MSNFRTQIDVAPTIIETDSSQAIWCEAGHAMWHVLFLIEAGYSVAEIEKYLRNSKFPRYYVENAVLSMIEAVLNGKLNITLDEINRKVLVGDVKVCLKNIGGKWHVWMHDSVTSNPHKIYDAYCSALREWIEQYKEESTMHLYHKLQEMCDE